MGTHAAFAVPEGPPKIARQFTGGYRPMQKMKSAGGTTELLPGLEMSAVPTGTRVRDGYGVPALKRRAIFTRPSGTDPPLLIVSRPTYSGPGGTTENSPPVYWRVSAHAKDEECRRHD